MGRRNVSGMQTQCPHCGYVWFTQSEADVTSCPHCGWRVRLRPSDGGSASDALITERKRERLI